MLASHWSQWSYLWFSQALTKSKPGCLEWMERKIRPFLKALMAQRHYQMHLIPALLSFLFLPGTLSSSDQWLSFIIQCFFPPFHLQPVPHCTAMQILQCNLCYPRVQPGLMNSIWLKCETSPLACYLHRRSGLRQLDIQTRGSPGCLGGALSNIQHQKKEFRLSTHS